MRPSCWPPRAVRSTRRKASGDTLQFDLHAFGLQPDISIDYAVMERADNVHVVPAKFGWSDVGSWPSVAKAQTPDASGNTMPADVVAIDTTGTHVQVDSHGPKVVATLGVHDLVIVDTPDALLVAHKNSAQEVKKIVDTLKARKHETVHLPAVVHRPWGTYASLKEEDGYKVKRITVKPGESLSLQYHHQRAEHWVVVQGTAMVQIGDVEHKTLPGEYRYIPLKEKTSFDQYRRGRAGARSKCSAAPTWAKTTSCAWPTPTDAYEPGTFQSASQRVGRLVGRHPPHRHLVDAGLVRHRAALPPLDARPAVAHAQHGRHDRRHGAAVQLAVRHRAVEVLSRTWRWASSSGASSPAW